MKHTGTIAVFAALAVVSCSQESGSPGVAADIEMWEGELPIREPWLRDRLPDDALMYARIPNLYGLIATPKGNVLDTGLRSRANVENIQKLRTAMVDNVLPLIPAFENPQLMLFERHVQSPIEIAGTFLPAPSALVAVTLNLESNADFEALVSELGLPLAAPLDDQGVGQLAGLGFPALIRFEAATGRLLINGGPGANEQRFAELVSGLERDTPHPMRAMEDRVDASGQGLFAWMNVQEALPAMQMFVPMEQYQQMSEIGLDKADSVGIGWGVANGKGRFSVVADVGGDRGLLPVVSNPLTAHSVGAPDGLMVISVPGMDYFERVSASSLWTDEDSDTWAATNEEFSEMAGVTIADVFAALGPEVLVIFDRAGDYAAVRVRDRALFDDLIERIAATTGSSPDRVERGGTTYFHWAAPSQFSYMNEIADGELGWLGELGARLRDHYYWVHEGDYVYLGSTPQVLFDRAALGADTDIGEWLSNEQRIDASSALLSFSGTSRKLPMRLYSFYIEMVQLLGDLAIADVDVWSMPSPAELNLPERGTLGLTISIGDPTLAMEMTFENNPVEMLGGLGGVAAVGVFAGISIPAYHDYTVRAQIAEGLNLSAGTKAAVAEFYATEGRYPTAVEADVITMSNPVGEHVSGISIEPDTGVIFIDYLPSVSGGGRLFLEPTDENGALSWGCYGTFQDKHLPAACRQ